MRKLTSQTAGTSSVTRRTMLRSAARIPGGRCGTRYVLERLLTTICGWLIPSSSAYPIDKSHLTALVRKWSLGHHPRAPKPAHLFAWRSREQARRTGRARAARHAAEPLSAVGTFAQPPALARGTSLPGCAFRAMLPGGTGSPQAERYARDIFSPTVRRQVGAHRTERARQLSRTFHGPLPVGGAPHARRKRPDRRVLHLRGGRQEDRRRAGVRRRVVSRPLRHRVQGQGQAPDARRRLRAASAIPREPRKPAAADRLRYRARSEEQTSELQSRPQ